MTTIEFTILGNQDDTKGNPLGYKRMLKQHMRADSVRYLEWCEYVRDCFYERKKIGMVSGEFPIYVMKNPSGIFETGKPFTTTRASPARMDLEIEYANDVRPDSDNVFKGIADALFENDKYLMAGSYQSKMSSDKVGRVKVKIQIADAKEK